MSFISELGTRRYITNDKRSYSLLMQRLSVAVHQRGNAACAVGSMPHTARWDELFYV